MSFPEPDARVVRAQVLQALAVLQPLADGFLPVGALVEDARMALAGHGGLTATQLGQLRSWAARWQALDPRLRQLYAQHLGRGAVQAALWTLLVARRPCTPSGAVYGGLRALWADVYGYPPSLELVPWVHLRTVSP